MTPNSNREEAKQLERELQEISCDEHYLIKTTAEFCSKCRVRMFESALSHARKAALEEAAKVAEKFAWTATSEYAAHETARHCEMIAAAIRALSQQEDGKDG